MSCRLTGVRLSVMHPCQTFVFLDLESTGLSGVGEKPRITEVSMVAVHRTMLRRSHHLPRVMDKLTVCVYPMRQVTPVATDLTGLTNDNLFCHKDFDGRLAMLLSGFITRLDPPVCLVAHNGNRFDFGLLQVELHRVDQTLPSGLLCVDSLQMFQHIDVAEASTVAAIHNFNPEVCTPQKQVTSPEKRTEVGSNSLHKRKPDSVTRLISPHPQTAKKRLFEEKDVGLLEHAAPEVSSGDDDEQQNAADAGVENCEDDAADVNINSGSWSLDVTDSELLAADTNATNTENGTLSKTSLEKDAQNRDSASHDQPVVPVTKLVDRVGISQAVSGVVGPCNITSGTGMSTPAKVKVMSTSILMNTPPYSPGYASRVATLNRSGSSSKKKQCYTLRELHKRVVGVYPCNSHHAEGDCLALVRIFQNAAQQACEWADCHAVPFSSIPPLYIPKARRSLSDGTFPYQI